MTKRAATLTALLLAVLCVAAPAKASFGLHDLSLSFAGPPGQPTMQAASHRDVNVEFAVNTTVKEGILVPDEEARDILSQLPPGLLASPDAVPLCGAAEFAAGGGEANCPDASSLGVFDLVFGFGAPEEFKVPVYNLEPPPGRVLRLGFKPLGVPVVIDAGINPDPPYNGFADSEGTSQAAFFYSGTLSIWGNPVDESHDAERGKCASSNAADLCEANVAEKPFTLLPRSCTGPLQMSLKARSWQHPETWLEYLLNAPPTTNCTALRFAPEVDSRLSTGDVSSPSGLSFDLTIPDPGIGAPEGIASSDIKRTEVTFAEGLQINPAQAEGLAVCSEAQLARETAFSEPGDGCPQAAKIGTVEDENPLLEGVVLKGSVFVAEPYANPFKSLIAVYIVVKNRELGINVRVPGKVVPDPVTGQIKAIFENMPQVPLGRFRLHLREGARSPLISPPGCGTYTNTADFNPWANPTTTVRATSSFRIDHGVGGGPCPSGAQPFEPGFEAASQSNAAGHYSPFGMELTRRDGDRDLTRFDVTLPPGVIGRIAGTAQCSDDQIAAARSRSGRDELASPSCPAGSAIGRVRAGAGAGSQLTYVPGSLYLAGPFGGAPLSVVAIVPAVAGPFDVGTVVTRVALKVDPRTARVSVDGSRSDPIPHMLAGIPLAVRDIQAFVDKANFTLNPTSCDPFATTAAIFGEASPVVRSSRYQAASCGSLGFHPRLALHLRGGTRRGAFPALRLTYRPTPGDANLKRLALRFPRSEFIEQGHFRTICTRVQFAADGGHGGGCPGGAVYGHAKVYSPLIDGPAEGPVYLRSSDHNLPDVVLALKGPPGAAIDIEVPARIDSAHGGLRAIAGNTPDVPVSRAVINMRGGQKGLFVNSTNLCAAKYRAKAVFLGQNGGRLTLRPLMRARGCG